MNPECNMNFSRGKIFLSSKPRELVREEAKIIELGDRHKVSHGGSKVLGSLAEETKGY